MTGKIFSVIGRKGGALKTTAATTLSAGLAASGLNVILVDSDSQGNASETFGVEPRDAFAELILNNGDPMTLAQRVTPRSISSNPDAGNCLHIISSSEGSRDVDASNQDELPGRIYDHLQALARFHDVVVVDTSPALNGVHIGCYYASDYLLLPTTCEEDSAKSIRKTLGYLEQAREAGGGDIDVAKILGILPGRYVSGRLGSMYWLGFIHGQHEDQRVFDFVPESGIWADARKLNQSIYAYQATNPGSRDALRRARKAFDPVIEAVLEVL